MRYWLFPIADFIFKYTLATFATVDIKGYENVLPNRPMILVSNHLSNVDPPLVARVTKQRPVFLAKKGLFQSKIIAFLLRSYGVYPVQKSGSNRDAMRWATWNVKEGKSLVIFPEGTRSKSVTLQEGLPGIVPICLTTKTPILPIGIAGTEKLRSVMRVFMPYADIRVRIGKPFAITPKTKVTRDILKQATDEIMYRIADLIPCEYRGRFANGISDNEFQLTTDYSD